MTPLFHHTFRPWRASGDRRIVASERHWRQPVAWNRAAEQAGERRRVEVACEVFEDWQGACGDCEMHCRRTGEPLSINARGHIWPIGWPSMSDGDDWGAETYTVTMARNRIFATIDATPHLTWCITTAFPENAARMMPWGWGSVETAEAAGEMVPQAFTGKMIPRLPAIRPNLWLGVPVRTQVEADARIPALLRVPSALRYVVATPGEEIRMRNVPGLNKLPSVHCSEGRGPAGIDWLIIRGETGPDAKPMHPDAVRGLIAQATAAGVPVWFEGWGEYAPNGYLREHPMDPHEPRVRMSRVGKAAAGAMIDGREWREVPNG